MTDVKGRAGVFLDRDGILVDAPVVKGSPTSARSMRDLRLIPDAVDLCRGLALVGIPTFMFTNQPDISRGLLAREIVDAQNDFVATQCALTSVRVCPHDEIDKCQCRKPRPGMILDLAEEFELDIPSSVVVGDRWRDIDAGNAAGARTIFVDYGYTERKPQDATATVTSMRDVATILSSLLEIQLGPAGRRKL